MKFISVSMVKDEADIIELFIRINSRIIDHFFIIDNGSTDGTLRILEKLKNEGFPMTVFIDQTPHFQQSAMITKLLKTALAKMPFDWAFAIDADEFINIEREKLETELATVPHNYVATLNWSHWVPRGDIYYNYTNPLWSAFDRKKQETDVFPKVIVSNNIARDCIIEMGNHHALINYRETTNGLDMKRVPEQLLTCGTLDHVPVRSSHQILGKAICGAGALSLKTNRNNHEGYHWDTITNLIKENNFTIDNLLIRYIALAYVSRPNAFVEDDVDSTVHIGKETDIIQYRNLSIVSEHRVLYNYTVRLANQIRQMQPPRGVPGGPL